MYNILLVEDEEKTRHVSLRLAHHGKSTASE